MKEIIVKFDETICDKISKANLLGFKAKLDSEFISKTQNAVQNELVLGRENKLQSQINDLNEILS